MLVLAVHALFPPPLAHLGHWYVGGPIFCAPVVLLIIWIKAAGWRERRARARRATLPPPGSKLLVAYRPLKSPLWTVAGAEVHPDDMPLAADTRRALSEWVERLDELTEFGHVQPSDDPRGRDLDVEGRRLSNRVRQELGGTYPTSYESVSGNGARPEESRGRPDSAA